MRSLLLGVLLLAGCSRAPMPAGQGEHTASKPTVQAFLFESGVPSQWVFLWDNYYALPTRAWLAGEFSHQLLQEQVRRGLRHYEDPANNCNKFSRFAAAYAAELFYQSPGRPRDCALLFGEWAYLRDNGTGHMINVAIVRENGKLVRVFYEPQLPGLVALSTNEATRGIARF